MASDTSTYKLNHTMIRIKDPDRTIKFYSTLGLTLIDKMALDSFTLYFLANDSPLAAHHGVARSAREGILELTHNHGSETDADFSVSSGNTEPHLGFAHICISVDNLQAACQKFESLGHTFQTRLGPANTATVLDPDGYWVQLLGQSPLDQTASIADTNPGKYRLNHTQLRIASPTPALEFYHSTLGMTLISTHTPPSQQHTLYYLAYRPAPSSTSSTSASDTTTPFPTSEGILALKHIHGTETKEGFRYHSGNDAPQGFGHVCISVDDLEAACARLDEKGVRWKKRREEGRMREIAFLLDADGYWVEVIGNQTLRGKKREQGASKV